MTYIRNEYSSPDNGGSSIQLRSERASYCIQSYDSTDFTNDSEKNQNMEVIKLTEAGEKMGYTGESLRQFVDNEVKKAAEKERQQMEREEQSTRKRRKSQS